MEAEHRVMFVQGNRTYILGQTVGRTLGDELLDNGILVGTGFDVNLLGDGAASHAVRVPLCQVSVNGKKEVHVFCCSKSSR